ncbi:hypothetical protein HPB47_004803 [Ixodes persulcatus]|uniref:Uncharacterized protein n=1 Tax=Ixodes persulcatus TaxID=34615 RepID=A0AC60PEN2_IXOPE|nr:hypothetical protein HPB47_004803 [Ixodes persulcatus]
MTTSVLKALRCEEYKSRSVGRASFATYSVLRRLHSRPDNEFGIENQGREVPPLACTFFPGVAQQDLVAVADEDGCISLFNSGAERVTRLTTWAAHENAVFELAVRPWHGHLATACGDLSVTLWDIARRDKVAAFRAHTGSVKCVCFAPHSPVMRILRVHGISTAATGHRKKPRGRHKEASLPLTVIKVWDLRKNYELYQNDPKPLASFPYAGRSSAIHGYTCLRLRGASLFASCMDSRIYRFNASSYNPMPLGQFVGHSTGSFYVKMDLSPDGQFLLSGSSDGHAYLWNVREPGPPSLRLSVHTAEVSALAWHPWDVSRLVTCGDDHKVVFWNATGDNTGAAATCEPMAASEPVALTTPGTVNGACGGTGRRPEQMTPKTPRRSRQEPTSLANWLTPPFKRRLHDGQPADKELTTPPRPVESPAVPPSAILTRKGHKMVARLFQRSMHQNRAKPRVKRALIIHNTKPITSFFNKWPE